MGEDTVTALTIVQESVRAEGVPTNVKITEETLKSCRAYMYRHDEYIQWNKERAEKERKMKRKTKFETEIEEIQKKKKKLEETVTSFDQESLKLALKAEETGNLHFFSKSNALRKAVKEKKKKISECEEQIKIFVLKAICSQYKCSTVTLIAF